MKRILVKHIYLLLCSSIVLVSSCRKESHTADEKAPNLISLAPNEGTRGTQVTIKGEGFSNLAADNDVRFDGVSAAVSSATSDQLIVSAPQHLPGRVAVTVSRGGKSSNALVFTYVSSADSYIPKANRIYTYSVSTPTEDFILTSSVENEKDSADCHVAYIKNLFAGNSLTQRVYQSPLNTVYEMNAPKELYQSYQLLSHSPGFVTGVLEGTTVYQNLPNNAQAGTGIPFTNGPTHMRIVTNGQGNAVNTMDYYQYLTNGKVEGFEPATTQAGTFDCMKWSYDVQVLQQLNGGTIIDDRMHRTLWYAKGIGLVKSLETGTQGTSYSTLIKIE